MASGGWGPGPVQGGPESQWCWTEDHRPDLRGPSQTSACSAVLCTDQGSLWHMLLFLGGNQWHYLWGAGTHVLTGHHEGDWPGSLGPTQALRVGEHGVGGCVRLSQHLLPKVF